jgi:MraZ protein
MRFRGRFDYTVDDKGRVALPPRYRTAFDAGAVLLPGMEPCIAVYTPEGFEQRAAIIERLPFESAEGRLARRAFWGSAYDVTKDAQGRILIPEKLLQHAGIRKGAEVVVVGVNECLEVWEKARWEAQEAEQWAVIPAVMERTAQRGEGD